MPKLTYKKIVKAVLAARPNLPTEEFLAPIRFQWNEPGLSAWDGGNDVNEDLRWDVIDALEPEFDLNDIANRQILRFLVEQERLNSYHGETVSEGMRSCFNGLSDLRQLDDVYILFTAIDNSSFDANLALDKDRMFYCGYAPVMEFIRNHPDWDQDSVERMEWYADYFGFNAPGWEPYRGNNF